MSARVSEYIANLKAKIEQTAKDVSCICCARTAASGAEAAEGPCQSVDVGPAGGVTGRRLGGRQAGFPNLLTFDMGGTSTDVALIQNGEPRLRRETTVGNVTVRASSLDMRTVGAGGGSIAKVPELTKALRVGPQSAGAEPGPAAYGKGGDRTDRDRRQRGAGLSAGEQSSAATCRSNRECRARRCRRSRPP